MLKNNKIFTDKDLSCIMCLLTYLEQVYNIEHLNIILSEWGLNINNFNNLMDKLFIIICEED